MMTATISFHALGVCVLCLSLPCLGSDDIQIGDAREVVIQKLGNPTVSAPSGNRDFCYFKQANVDFIDGKVVSFTMLSDEGVRTQRQQGEEGRILRQQQKSATSAATSSEAAVGGQQGVESEVAKALLGLEYIIRRMELTVDEGYELRRYVVKRFEAQRISSPALTAWLQGGFLSLHSAEYNALAFSSPPLNEVETPLTRLIRESVVAKVTKGREVIAEKERARLVAEKELSAALKEKVTAAKEIQREKDFQAMKKKLRNLERTQQDLARTQQEQETSRAIKASMPY